ncbi:hypothetical protein VZ95_04075 [Elstera litoralis]|uniref:Lipoprotein n=1 Tax=Elstera litoralis TaxID=552518 RepID=A0A0F3IVC1_9PROT|nr:hypothetical protein [Elstera litoralis]KJV10567.1 hypothetical protein VZ95_04075 [Elstera litoralis]
MSVRLSLLAVLVLLSGCVTGSTTFAHDRYYYDPPRPRYYYPPPPPPVYYRPAPEYRPVIIYRDRPYHHRRDWREHRRDRWDDRRHDRRG